MLKKIYIHNYRCFQNFELNIDTELHSYLFLGRNGSGKSNLVAIIAILKQIGEGESNLHSMIHPNDFNFNQPHIPIQITFEIEIGTNQYEYALTVDPKNSESNNVLQANQFIRLTKESLKCNEQLILNRVDTQVEYQDSSTNLWQSFALDTYTLALPILGANPYDSQFWQFKAWIAKIYILSPIPALMSYQTNDTINRNLIIKPTAFADNIMDWFSDLLSRHPKTYVEILSNLQIFFPELVEINTPQYLHQGARQVHKSVTLAFKAQDKRRYISFYQLSDGEKIFFLQALLIATIKVDEVSLCVWDEPDNYISLLEMQHYIRDFRRAFANSSAQFLATTHNPEAMRTFTSESTYVLTRNSHLQPTKVRLLEEDNPKYDIVKMIKSGLIEL